VITPISVDKLREVFLYLFTLHLPTSPKHLSLSIRRLTFWSTSKSFLEYPIHYRSKVTRFVNIIENRSFTPSLVDLAAIPDFASGAMENWGLITYRETAILYDPIETSTMAHQYVAIVIAHELAHQWFGNLVTMKWWNDLWLNEGFASYLEYLGVDNLFPEWKMMEQFILDKTQPALALDALSSSHPISVAVHDPAEIEAIFDTISYSKVSITTTTVKSFDIILSI
jgi:aminopeptidase N